MTLNVESISGSIGVNRSVNGNLGARRISGTATIPKTYDRPIYTGETIVTPRASEEQVLETAQKTVLDNIVVLEIPYTEVTNPSGGLTVNIA